MVLRVTESDSEKYAARNTEIARLKVRIGVLNNALSVRDEQLELRAKRLTLQDTEIMRLKRRLSGLKSELKARQHTILELKEGLALRDERLEVCAQRLALRGRGLRLALQDEDILHLKARIELLEKKI